MANCEKWKDLCCRCPLYSLAPKKSLIDKSKRNFVLKRNLIGAYRNLTIVPVSEWVGSVVKHSFLKNHNIMVIPNGIDLEVFNPGLKVEINKQPCDEKTYTYMAVASYWTKDKGIYDYIKLSKYLAQDERLVLVGYDKQKYRYSLPKNIITVPPTKSQGELASLYARADVVLSLSYAETFGLTIAEAAACGTPAVVYNNTALPDLVTEETGRVVPTGDVGAVYKALQEIRNNEMLLFMSGKCIDKAQKEFDKTKCFMKYADLYNKLIVDRQ